MAYITLALKAGFSGKRGGNNDMGATGTLSDTQTRSRRLMVQPTTSPRSSLSARHDLYPEVIFVLQRFLGARSSGGVRNAYVFWAELRRVHILYMYIIYIYLDLHGTTCALSEFTPQL